MPRPNQLDGGPLLQEPQRPYQEQTVQDVEARQAATVHATRQEALVSPGDVMKVVGGAGVGGILVRRGKETSSPELSERLSNGAIVRVLEQDGKRLRFEILMGTGPAEGWVTSNFKGKDLMTKIDVRAELENEMNALTQDTLCSESCRETPEGTGDALEDSDGDEMILCAECNLPVGDIAYAKAGQDCSLVHGECMAQLMLCSLKHDENTRQQESAALKSKRRADYDIGWKVERMPHNVKPAEKLGCCLSPTDMCRLVLQEGELARSVYAARTTQPGEAVNLEYLSIALQVRRLEGKEPVFSLDPVSAKNTSNDERGLRQVKHFEPKWLAGTSVGEVLFQADYHLKELSMGEYEQPVVGMKSCFDDCTKQCCAQAWSGREWFIVKKAEVHLSEDNALIPYVKMGVEAREQTWGTNGLEDTAITRQDHPLVKYAKAFTHNFDIIAERKSVIHELREVAKASTLAKFLFEAEIDLDASWFDLASGSCLPCMVEIPQLWNTASFSRISVKDGMIVEAARGSDKGTHGVYGGVKFGLERFSLSAAAPEYNTRLAPRGAPRPRGVDLNLNDFNLAQIVRRTCKEGAGSWSSLDAAVATGDAFWEHLTEDSNALKKRDKQMLVDLFNPCLSDRRDEGDRFVPPDSSMLYVSRLRELLEEEKHAQEARKQYFLSAKFTMDDAGPLFPTSWSSLFKLANGDAIPKVPGELLQGGSLRAKSSFEQQVPLFELLIQGAAPVLDRTAEDGTRFRIYRLGSLEVRSTQMPNGKEMIGAAFTVHALRGDGTVAVESEMRADMRETISKVTEYVERTVVANNSRSSSCHFYVVFETAPGNQVVTEKCNDGTVMWEENPADLHERNAFAKVLRSADCAHSGTTVQDMRRHCVLVGKRYTRGSQYSREAYEQAIGSCQRRALAIVMQTASGDGQWSSNSGRSQCAVSRGGYPRSGGQEAVPLRAGRKNCFEKLFSERDF